MNNQRFHSTDAVHATSHGSEYEPSALTISGGNSNAGPVSSEKGAADVKLQANGILPAVDLIEAEQSQAARTETSPAARPTHESQLTADSLSAKSEAASIRGVNLSGGEFKGQALWPTASEFKYYQKLGLTYIRLPVSWENLQPNGPGKPLDKTSIEGFETTMKLAHEYGMKLIVDLHDYDHYNGKGNTPHASGETASAADLKSFWGQMAKVVTKSKYGSSVIGYDLMNEPANDSSGGKSVWPENAQAAIDAIRQVDKQRYILVEADNFSGAQDWDAYAKPLLKLKDPEGKIIFEAHSYWDSGYEGNYHTKMVNGKVQYQQPNSPNEGIEKAKQFVDWLKANKKQGIVGEFGVPTYGQPSKVTKEWLSVEKNFLKYLNANGVGWTAWGGGQYYGGYNLRIDGKPEAKLLSENK